MSPAGEAAVSRLSSPWSVNFLQDPAVSSGQPVQDEGSGTLTSEQQALNRPSHHGALL